MVTGSSGHDGDTEVQLEVRGIMEEVVPEVKEH